MEKPNKKPIFTFPKSEKLCSKILIDDLFVKPNIIKAYPFKLFWKVTDLPTSANAQVVIIVPKRIVNKANKRNKTKRFCREAYRLNKHIFIPTLTETDTTVSLALLYLSADELTFEKANKAVQKLFKQLANEIK